MKKFIATLLLLLMPVLQAREEVITPELLQLLEHFKIEHDGTLASVTDATQKAWLRPAGQERWEVVCTYTAEDRAKVIEYYAKTGKFEEKFPSKKRYHAVLLCGATMNKMSRRIRFFERVVDAGVHVDNVALIAGARPLTPSIGEVVEDARTEGDAFVSLWKISRLSQELPWRIAEHPMKGDRRPDRYDTFKYWLQKEFPPQTLLIVTDQPYCCFTEAIAAKAFPEGFDYEVVGEGFDPSSMTTAVLLDNLARWLYAVNN